MNLLTIEDMSKSYTERMLFDNVSLGINVGDKIGVIGINGTGKSTLFKIIAGLEDMDQGNLIKGRKVGIAYLPQTPEFDDNMTLLENVIHGLEAEEEYHNLEGEARAMLIKFGITDPDSKPDIVSGGQRKRAALVRTLLLPADLLVLDEPTNHLDSEMAEWLEDYLFKYRGAFIMITHDRYFLDKTTNRILEVDKGNLYSYTGNYSRFLELKTEREEIQMATERKAKSLYRIELEWMQRGVRARATKQKAHTQRFEELRDRAVIEDDDRVQINALSSRMGKKTIELNNICKAYDDKILIRDFTYILLHGDRIGIIGANGCGKSTLLNVITGMTEPNSGSIEIGTTIRMGYFSQENEYMDQSLKVIEYIKDTAEYIETSEGTITASQMCERFLFTGAMQYSQIERLSGGEKRRLYLLKILMEAPNVLVLDEPTNDLDIQTLTILEEYLNTFPGIVLTVSHDRYFLDKIATRIFAFEGDGFIRQYEGNFSDYKAAKARRDEEGSSVDLKESNKEDSQPASVATWKQRSNKLKFTYQEQKEYNEIDEEIEHLEQRLKDVDAQIEKSTTDFEKLNELMGQKEKLEEELEHKMDRWVYLNDLAEQIEVEKNGS